MSELADLEVLYEEHAAGCWSLAYRLLLDREDSQRAVRDAFLGLWQQWSVGDALQVPVRSWLLLRTFHAVVELTPDACRDRQVVLLAVYGDVTQREIASCTGTSVVKVRAAMRSGLLALRDSGQSVSSR